MAFLVRREIKVCLGLDFLALLVNLGSLGHRWRVHLGNVDKKESKEKMAYPVNQVSFVF